MIRIEGLTLHFDSFQIVDLNIQIEEGEFHFLLGPTGSGKTLILESIMGLQKPKRGKIWIGEGEVQNLPPEQREISYVPQDMALFPHLKVRENILFGIRARNLDMEAYEDYIDTLTRVTKLAPLLDRYPANLSGGEKRRVALLRALAPKPKLLLLDEPLSGLDPSMRTEIQYLLKTLHSSFHPTTLCVTHDFEEAYFLGEGITVCIAGKVEQTGRKEEVFRQPRSRKVAEFLGARNLYRAKVAKKGERLILDVNRLQFSISPGLCPESIEVGQNVDLFIRPEEVMIIRDGKPIKNFLNQNLINGKIRNIFDRGGYQIIEFISGEEIPFEISIPNYVFRNLSLSVGKAIQIALREESLWVMS